MRITIGLVLRMRRTYRVQARWMLQPMKVRTQMLVDHPGTECQEPRITTTAPEVTKTPAVTKKAKKTPSEAEAEAKRNELKICYSSIYCFFI